jgi:hypothetical protein
MSWTVACFCGTVFQTPPELCPTCDSPVPDTQSAGRAGNAPQRPSATPMDDASAKPTCSGSLERELSELIASAPPAG